MPSFGLGAYAGEGANEVGKFRYSEQERRIYVNNNQFFGNVPPAVWAFQIGGYPVVQKYLKNRKGRTLSLSEVENIEKVINVLAFTVEQMKKIDRDYLEAIS